MAQLIRDSHSLRLDGRAVWLTAAAHFQIMRLQACRVSRQHRRGNVHRHSGLEGATGETEPLPEACQAYDMMTRTALVPNTPRALPSQHDQSDMGERQAKIAGLRIREVVEVRSAF
jgi:hypothetical protein